MVANGSSHVSFRQVSDAVRLDEVNLRQITRSFEDLVTVPALLHALYWYLSGLTAASHRAEGVIIIELFVQTTLLGLMTARWIQCGAGSQGDLLPVLDANKFGRLPILTQSTVKTKSFVPRSRKPSFVC